MGITRLMAKRVGETQYQCNAIAPGYMSTNNTQQLRADAQRSAEIRPYSGWTLGATGRFNGPVVFSRHPAPLIMLTAGTAR